MPVDKDASFPICTQLHRLQKCLSSMSSEWQCNDCFFLFGVSGIVEDRTDPDSCAAWICFTSPAHHPNSATYCDKNCLHVSSSVFLYFCSSTCSRCPDYCLIKLFAVAAGELHTSYFIFKTHNISFNILTGLFYFSSPRIVSCFDRLGLSQKLMGAAFIYFDPNVFC